jgi:general secretion pathway protein H
MSRRLRVGPRGGFTLLESLAALAILALVIGASTALLAPPSPKLRAEAAARGLCAALRATRARAVAMREETTLTLDLARKIYASPATAPVNLPSDATIDISAASDMRVDGARAGVLFFPSGRASGADIAISISGRRAEVEVNWLTGATRCRTP